MRNAPLRFPTPETSTASLDVLAIPSHLMPLLSQLEQLPESMLDVISAVVDKVLRDTGAIPRQIIECHHRLLIVNADLVIEEAYTCPATASVGQMGGERLDTWLRIHKAHGPALIRALETSQRTKTQQFHRFAWERRGVRRDYYLTLFPRSGGGFALCSEVVVSKGVPHECIRRGCS